MKPRPHAELIHYWADGGEVQKWREYLVEDSKEITKKSFWQDDPSPTFSPDNLYRPKPEKKKYRVAKFINSNNELCICYSEQHAKELEGHPCFAGWADDWVEYE